MSKTEMVRARMEPGLKEQAESILEAVGLNPTDAITLFYKQIALHNGLPFEVKVPNAVTLQAMRDMDEGKNTKRMSLSEFKESLNL